MSDANDVVKAALDERVRQCVAFGYCLCAEDGTVNPDCPCHNVEAIAITPAEQVVAPSVVNSDVVLEEEANPT